MVPHSRGRGHGDWHTDALQAWGIFIQKCMFNMLPNGFQISSASSTVPSSSAQLNENFITIHDVICK